MKKLIPFAETSEVTNRSGKRLLTLEKTSERTGLSIKAIRMKQWRKQFPCTKIAGRIFVEEAELDRFLSLARKVTAEQAVERGEAA